MARLSLALLALCAVVAAVAAGPPAGPAPASGNQPAHVPLAQKAKQALAHAKDAIKAKYAELKGKLAPVIEQGKAKIAQFKKEKVEPAIAKGKAALQGGLNKAQGFLNNKLGAPKRA